MSIQIGQNLTHALAPKVSQSVMQVTGGFSVPNRCAQFQTYGTSVQPRFHLHNANASFGITRHHRAMDRGGPAPPGQKASMDVQTAVCGCIQNRLGQQQPISHDHRHIRPQARKGRDIIYFFEIHRVAHGQAQFQSTRMHRG